MNRHIPSFARVVLVLLVARAMVCPPVLAAGPPVTLEAYWQHVQETQSLVTRLAGALDVDRTQLLAAAEQWEGIQEILLANGTRMPVDHSHLVALLRAEEPDLSRVDALLSALLHARDAWPAASTNSFDAATLDRILARAEFQWPLDQPSPIERWLAQLQEWLRQWLPDLPWSGEAPLPGNLLAGLAAIMLVLVVAYVVKELASNLVQEAELDDRAGQDDVPMTAAAALKRAEALSGEHDYRNAVRFLYLSAILTLEEHGLLRYDRSQTNREYLRSVAHLPDLAARLRRVIDVFERVWYGYHAIDEAAYARYESWVGELRLYR